MSPVLFNIYIDNIIRRWQKKLQQMESSKLSINMLIADHHVIITDSEENLERMAHKLHVMVDD
jgi:hypothetical protein